MKSIYIAFSCIASCLAGPAAAATLAHDYQLNGSLDDSLGGASMAAIGTPTQTATGVNFFNGNGLSLAGSAFPNTISYSILMNLQVDSANGAFGYGAILLPRAGDGGVWVFGPGSDKVLTYYAGGNHGSLPFGYGTMHEIAFVRDGDASTLRLYVDGASSTFAAGFANSDIDPDSFVRFFNHSAENASGFVDRIRIYDGVLTDSEIGAAFGPPPAVPEPASWAMMIVGFGAVGASLRGRPARRAPQRRVGAAGRA